MQRRTSTRVVLGDQSDARRIGERHRLIAADRDEVDIAALAKEKVELRLARLPTAARTAWWILDMHHLHPVPLDTDLTPVGAPLDTVEKVLDHWHNHPGHGVGIATGKHPVRPWSYLAVEVDRFGSWNDWLRDAAAYTVKRPNFGGYADLGGMPETGPPEEFTEHRDPGAYTRLLWIAPPLPGFRTYRADASGGPLVRRMEEAHVGRGGWIWLVVPDSDGDLKVARPREVTEGVTALPTGTVIPWENSRNADGWTLRLETPRSSMGGLAARIDTHAAPWLVEKLTGRKAPS